MTTGDAARQVSVERVIDAPPEHIFDVLADPTMHPVIDGSDSVRGTLDADVERLRLGSRFGMSMRIGLSYRIRNVVVEFEEGRRIAWRHWGHHRWRWELEPTDGRTRVIHTFDWSTALLPNRMFIVAVGYPERNRRAMERTIDRLAEEVTGGSSADAR